MKNDHRERREQEEIKGELRKKKIFQNLIRSKEEKELDMKELDLMVEKYNYMAIRYFINNNNYYYAERVIQIMEYFKFLDKIRNKRGRLKPSGALDGIMFIGINPSVRSMLVNVWDDPFGKYFGKMLEEAGIDKSKIWMTNLYKRPTEKNRKLSTDEIKEGLEELEVEIKYVNPKIIVTLGHLVSDSVWRYFMNKASINVIKMQHPAYIIRNNNPEERSKYLLELRELKKYNV